MSVSDGFADGRSGSSDAREAPTSLAEVLADCGELPARLVALHHDDGKGRCVVCSEDRQSANRVFPCRLRSLATAALHLQASRQAGRLLPKPGPGPAF